MELYARLEELSKYINTHLDMLVDTPVHIIDGPQIPEIDISSFSEVVQKIATENVQIQQISQHQITITISDIDIGELNIETINTKQLVFVFVRSRLKSFNIKNCSGPIIRFVEPKSSQIPQLFHFIDSGGTIDLTNTQAVNIGLTISQVEAATQSLQINGNNSNVAIHHVRKMEHQRIELFNFQGSIRNMQFSHIFCDLLQFDKNSNINNCVLDYLFVKNLKINSRFIVLSVSGSSPNTSKNNSFTVNPTVIFNIIILRTSIDNIRINTGNHAGNKFQNILICNTCEFLKFYCDINGKTSFKVLEFHRTNFSQTPTFISMPNDWPMPNFIEHDHHESWLNTYKTLSTEFNKFFAPEYGRFFQRLSEHFRHASTSSREARILLMLYRSSSNFGNSALLPAFWYLVFILLSIFAHIAVETHAYLYFSSEKNLSFNNSFPGEIYAVERIILSVTKGAIPLFGISDDSVGSIHRLVSIIHSVFSTLFIFLFGISVRRHLKISNNSPS